MPDPQKVEVLRLALRLGLALRPEDFFPDQGLVAAHFAAAPVSATDSEKDVA